MAPKKTPIRMCIACREMKPKREMLRVVKSPEGEISLDFKGKAPGRGAYICGSEECVKNCIKRKIFNKVFEADVPKEIYDAIREDLLAK
jgi:predicted RNA-binding protein YlxR (DUF448 family)